MVSFFLWGKNKINLTEPKLGGFDRAVKEVEEGKTLKVIDVKELIECIYG